MAWYDDPGVGRWADLITSAASKYGVDPALVAAHMKVESDGDPKAFNGEYGAAGLMQLIPDTARRLGVADPFDPAQAVDAGAKLIALNMQLAKGDPDLAKAIYFAGTDPKNYGAKTRAYIARINQLLDAWGGDGATVAQPERTAEETPAGEPAGEKPRRLPLDELFRRGTPISLLMQPEQPEPEAGALRTAGDIGVGLARGAVGLVGAGATLVGAATGNVDNAVRRVTGVVDEWLGSLESPALQAERQALAEAVAEQSGVFAKGWETYKQLLTRPRLLAQEIAAMAVPMGVAGKIGRMVGAGVAGSMGAQAGDWAGVGTSVSLFAAQQGAEVASDVYDRAIEMGAPEAAATDAARQAFLTASGISLATMLVPGGMTVEKALVRGLAGKEAAGVLARAGVGYIGESLQEGIEEGGGAYAGNISLRSIGLNVDPLEGVGEAFGAGAAVGGPLGGAFGAAQGLAARSTAGTVPLTGDTDTDLRAIAGAPVTPPTPPSAGPAPAWLDGDISAINTPAQAPSAAPQVPSSTANAAVPPSANPRQSPPQVPLADIGGMAQARATTPFAPAQVSSAQVPQVPVGAERGATSMGLSQLAALNVTPVAGRDDGRDLARSAGAGASIEAAGVLGGGSAVAGPRADDQVLQRGDVAAGSDAVPAAAAPAASGAVESGAVERYTVRTDAGNVGVQVERNPDFTVTATTTEATPRTLDIEPMLNAGVSLPEAIRAAVTGSAPREDVVAPTEVGPANQAAVAQWQQLRQQQTENRVRKLEEAQQETEFGDGETEFGEIPEIEPPPAGSAAAEFLRTIANNGGIDIRTIRAVSGERSGKGTKGIGNPTIPGRGKLFRKTGLTLDELATRMVEEGYLTEADVANRADNGGVNKLTEMIAAALAGNDVYRAGGDDARAIQRLQAEQQARDFEMMRDEADRLGIDSTGMSFNQLAARLENTDADVNAAAQVAADAQLADEVFVAVIEEYDGDPAFLDAEQRIALAMQYNEAAVERAALQQEDDADFLRAVQEIVDEARARQAAGDRTRSDATPDREAGQPGSGGPGVGAGPPGEGRGEGAAAGQAQGEVAPGFDLTQPTTEGLTRQEALRQQQAARQRERENAPPPEEFRLTGSDRPVDQARAAGQMELEPAAPAVERTTTADGFEATGERPGVDRESVAYDSINGIAIGDRVSWRGKEGVVRDLFTLPAKGPVDATSRARVFFDDRTDAAYPQGYESMVDIAGLKRVEGGPESRKLAPETEAELSGEPNESGFIGATDEETSAVGDEFAAAKAGTVEDGFQVTHVMDPPAKDEIVRLHDKAGAVRPKKATEKWRMRDGERWLTPEEARAKIEEWKANARKQGETSANRDRVVISMFDLTGEWSKPWEEAGYQVYRFDIQNAGMADIDGREVNVGDITNFSTEFFSELYGMFEGADVYAILAACPCTDFASSGAKHFAAKDADGRTIASVELVHHTLATIEFFKPQVWAIENPVGRIEKLTGLPPWRLSFDPFLFGDDYTKQTLLWGRFNADLPAAPVFPARGSIMHSKYGGKSIATKNARSVTPEGFAYAFFQANNAVDNPLLDVANKYDRLDKGALKAALDAGLTRDDISSLVDDFYYMDLDDAAANAALREAAKRGMPADNVRTKLESELRDYLAQMQGLTRAAEYAAQDKIRTQYPSQARSRGATYDRLLREQEQREHEARRGQRDKLQRKVDDVQRRINALERRERLASQPTGTLAEDTLVLMCCSDTKAKVRGPVPLRDLYTGPFWQSLKTNIGAISMDNVFVLSAKHGLQPSSAEFAPYNQKLTEKQVNAWLASRLTDDAKKIRARFPRGPRRVIVVGSGAYRSYFDALIEELQANGDIAPETVITRTEGAIGIQRQQLNAALAEVNNQTEARDGLQEERRQGQEVAPTAEAAGAARRTRPKNAIRFNNPIVGPSGARLTDYQWQWTMEEQVDSRGELVGRRVSNWDEAVPSADTGREIVHQFGVEMPDGTWQLVSAESAIKLMGFGKQEALKFKSVGTTAKTFARQQMELAAAEQSLATFRDDRQAILAGEVPEITVTTEMVDEAPKASPALRRPPVEYTTYTMGDASLSERSEYVRGQRGVELEGFVRQEWINNRLRERGWGTGTTEGLLEGKIAEIRKRIAKTEKRLAELTGGQVESGAPREPGAEMREGGVQYDVAPTLKPFPVAERREDRRNSLEPLRISPRLPTGVTATEDPMGPVRLQPGLEAMRRSGEKAFAKNMGLVATYTGYQPAHANETPDEIAERFIAHMVDNLRWLHDQFPAALRERAKLWYVGANRMAHRWADKYGFTPQQVAAAMAALSPQKHWFMNVSMAERIMDIVTTRADFRWSDRMEETAKRVLGKPEYVEVLKALRGKTLREVWEAGNEIHSAAWVRVFDEAHHYKGVRIVTPEGNFGGPAYGETGLPMLAQWGSFKEISNALSALADGAIENLSAALGKQHKVRSFYNNIIAPYSLEGDVTIDTHAVAAAQLLPLAGTDREVEHNFGSNLKGEPGAANSDVTGSRGTYGLYAEAYRRLAAELGILPRELQSITWEAVRGLYEARAKSTGTLKGDAKAVWQRYHAGEITDAQAREELNQLAGGITAPSWAGGRSGTGRNAKAWDSSYAGELPGTSLREPGTDRAGAGAGSGAARDVPAQLRERSVFYEPAGSDGETGRLGIPLARGNVDDGRAGRANRVRRLDAVTEVQFDDEPSPNGFFFARTRVVAESRRTLPVAQVRTAADAAAAFDSLGKYAVEHFDALVTDANGLPLAIVGSFKGGTGETQYNAGTLMAEATRVPGAATIWFAHNHPGGKAEFSPEDLTALAHLKDLFEGAEFTVGGLFAMTNTGQYIFTTGSTGTADISWVAPAPTGSRATSVPVIERMLATDVNDQGMGRLALERVSDGNRLVRHLDTLYESGASRSLLMFVDTQARVLGYYPLAGNEIEALRQHGRARRLFKAISEANPAGVFIVNNGDLTEDGIYNLGNALKPLKVEVVDVLERSPDGNYLSYKMAGLPRTSLFDGWFSRGTEGATSAEALPEVRSWAEGVAQALEGRVDVVVMDRPPAGMPADAEGAYVDGKVHLFAANLGSLRRAEEVLAHELVHVGLDKIGPEVAQVLRDIVASNANVAALADQWARANPGRGRLTAVNEAIAKISETDDITRQPWWQQLVAAVRAGLRKLGFVTEWTDNDVLRFIRTAHQAALSPAQQTTMRAALASAQPRTWYYSALTRAFEAQKDRTMPGAQWAAWLKSNKATLAVKDDEIEWSGLREYLELRGKDKVSRQDILAFLRENGVRVSEVGYEQREAWRQRLDLLETRGAMNLTAEERNELGLLRSRRADDLALTNPDHWLNRGAYSDFPLEASDEGVFVRFERGPAGWETVPRVVFEVSDTEERVGGLYEASELAELGVSDEIVRQAVALERDYKEAVERVGEAARRMSETRHDQYQLPGGENYRELLITLPARDDADYDRINEIDAILNSPEGRALSNRQYSDLTEERVALERKVIARAQQEFRSDHWAEPNILAHVRFNERTDADGRRVLFIEEIQSDWAQAGRKRGFKGQEMNLADRSRWSELIVRERNNGLTTEERAELDRLQPLADAARREIPSAPFVTDTKAWTALAVKRMVAWAVENGYDRVAFVTGQQSADRYSLSKQVSKIEFTDNSSGGVGRPRMDGEPSYGTLEAWNLQGVSIFRRGMEPSEVERYIGKEAAQRLFDQKPKEARSAGIGMRSRVLEGESLEFGGIGMKKFYDEIVPSVVNDVLKKLGGGKAGRTRIDTAPPNHQFRATRVSDNATADFENLREAETFVVLRRDQGEEWRVDNFPAQQSEQPAFDITPKMRAKVIEGGIALFSRAPAPGTPEFKRWFGDSKVVDADGNPLVAYHGTGADFTAFSTDFMYSGEGASQTGSGFYFTTNPESASRYAALAQSNGAQGRVLPVYLSIKNPLFIDFMTGEVSGADITLTRAQVRKIILSRPNIRSQEDSPLLNFGDIGYEGFERVLRAAVEMYAGGNSLAALRNDFFDNDHNAWLKALAAATGHDGAYTRAANGDVHWVAWQPEQIKSVYNRGTFDSSNPDILFSRPWQPALDAIAAHMDTAKTFNWWHKTVGTQLHKARISPAFARVYNKAEEYIQEVSRFANEAADAAPNLLPRLDKFADVLKSTRIADEDARAIAKPIFEGTLLWTRDGDEIVPSRNPTEGIVWTDEELRERFSLNDTQIGYYRQFRAAVDKSLDDLARAQMLRLADRFVRASNDPGRLREDVYAAGSLWRSAQVLADEIRRQRGGDTQEAMAGIERARTAPDAELPNVDRDLIDEIEQTAIRVAKLQLNGYAPLMRFGRYSVLVQNAETNEVEFFTTFESEGDAKRAVKELGEQPEFAESKITRGVMSEESWRTFGGMTPEVAEMFGEMLGVEQSEAFQVYLRAAKANYSAYKRLIHRKGIPGFSSDPTRTLAAFLTSNARAAAQALHAGEMDRAVQAIEEERGALGGRLGDVLDEARKLVDYVRTPGDAATQIRSFLFFQYIGGSIASALVNMTQPFMMTLPHLTQWTSMSSASRLLAKGMKHAFVRGGLDPELEAALARGERDGVVAPQEIHQLQAEASRRSEGISIAGRKIVSGYNLQRAMFVWGSFFSFAEQINRRSTFIAAYELARQRGEADPFAFAERVVVETQGSYTKANRPNWARGPVGATVFTFKQYTIAYLEWLRRLPRKDQAIALGLLVLLAGVQGLPGADDLDDLIDTVGEQLGFATSSKQWKRDLATKVLGRTGAEFMMRGVSVFLPLDIAGRMSFGNLFPATGLFKRSETNRTGELLEIAGVGGSAIQSLIDGGTSILRGDIEGAARTAAPLAVQNLYAGASMMASGEITDRRGRKVDEANLIEGAVKAVGFQPSQVAQSSRQQQEMWQQIRLLRAIEAEIAGDIARGRVERDVKAVQAARQRLADWNRNNPEARIQITESQIQQRMRALRADRESRLLGNAPREVRQRYQREMEALRVE